MDRMIERAWDDEYARGRYRDERSVPFVREILRCVRRCGLAGRPGIYIGCGNGRNFLPLVEGGLDLIGLDVSGVAITQLAERMPQHASRLIHGDLGALPADVRFPIVIGIQVFQHGDRETCYRLIRRAQGFLEPGGLIAVRVNATETDIEFEHDVIESQADTGITIIYRDGPKTGLPIHFFARKELDELFTGLHSESPLRLVSTERAAPAKGQWSQWEGIWRGRASGAPRGARSESG
jgi:methyltransferase family protein